MILIEKIKHTLCTGCASCEASCPQGAISMHKTMRGFYAPDIDYNKCIDCHLCEKRCPVLSTRPDCYAVWADDDIREKSSSGGVFSVLAEKTLNTGGVVFGAAWTDDLFVKHKYIESIDELDQLRRSKYVQSEIGDSYKNVKKFLEASRNVLFVGTPCQVAGLNNYLAKSYDNLITLDFICYNTPSIYSLRKYLNDNFGLNNVKSVDFRIKDFGWICSVMKITLKNDKVFMVNSSNSPYFKAFFNGYFAREACLNCRFSSFPHKSDITMGDFWKIEEHDPSWKDNKGTSLMLVNTDKGKAFIKEKSELFQRIQRVPFEWVSKTQHNCIYENPRKKYFEYLLGMKHFNEAINMAHENVFDVGMVCVQNYRNYGSAFTNFALYTILQKLNKSVYIITQPLDSIIQPGNFSNFKYFKYPDFSVAPSKANIQEMRCFNQLCRQFIVGSDQLFNYEIYKKISGFIKLDWVNDQKKKSVYAASFGINKILGSPQEISNMKKSLSRFADFSVREKDSVELINQTFDLKAQPVLDPVFLLEREDYLKLIKHTEEEKIGIFSYILNPNTDNEMIIRSISDSLNMPITSLADMWINQEMLKSLWKLPTETGYSNEKWLSKLINSSFVITDSFHAVCFSIIFNKPFIILPNKLRGEFRVKSLLRQLEIENRIYSDNINVENVDYLLNKIDYNKTNEKISILKHQSLNYLKSILL